MRIAEQVTFGGSGLDRAADLRADPGHVARLAQAAETRILPMWKGKPLVRPAADGMLTLASVAPGHAALSHAEVPPVLIGRSDGAVWFTQDISPWEPEGQETAALGTFLDPTEQIYPGLDDGARFAELRGIMTALTPRDAEIAATARAVLMWHSSHLFCARCGAASEQSEAGWQRKCPACNTSHFPRTDPVVIMLITRGNEVLLGRSPGWPEGMYSLLAGFIEPGETIEAAVRREVMEESGVEVGRVGYLASQPWPFPASLMMGCWGEALTEKITVDPVELEDACWVSREEMLSIMAGESTRIKPARRGAIAHFLIEAWIRDQLD